MMLWLRRLVHAGDNFGWRDALKRALWSLRDPLALAPPEPLADCALHPFDRERGTDTGGYVPGEKLHSAAAGRARFMATAFLSISPSSLAGALALLPEGPAGWTFVDIGCGKGRALLVAAEFRRENEGFDRVLGVDLSPELTSVALANAALAGVAGRVDAFTADALEFVLPRAPLVLFLYHPFLSPMLRQLLASVKRQLDVSPRPLYLLYANLSYHRMLRRTPWLREIWDCTTRLSDEDAAANNFDNTHERYTLYRAEA